MTPRRKREMKAPTSDTAPTEICFLCKRSFQFGEHIYAGRRINQWDLAVCDMCDTVNSDGVLPHRHLDLEPHLRARGIEIPYNADGTIALPRRWS